MKTLTIISHTEHYNDRDGNLVGLGSTVTEINHLLDVFDSITHVAMLHASEPPPNTLPYNSDKVNFVALPALGGGHLADKLRVIWNAPKILNSVRKSISNSDYFQFRAPTGIGVFVMPYLICFTKKKGWFKYAGNWKQEQAPLAYSFQRYLLKHQKRIVTINGYWPKQPQQCLTFENPCLTKTDVAIGQSVIQKKRFNKDNVELCFVGRLEEAKGLGILIDGINALTETEKNQIKKVHIVGDGNRKEEYQKQGLKTGVPFIFHGFLSREQVHDIYINAQAVILPSVSEGFPKVIAEAMNYGCLPIVSNVSSISHYITHDQNGFLLDEINAESTRKAVKKLLELSETEYTTMIGFQGNKINRFTYAYYNNRIVTDIL